MTQGLPETLPVMEGLVPSPRFGDGRGGGRCETPEQAHWAVQAGCDYLQGCLMADLPAQEGLPDSVRTSSERNDSMSLRTVRKVLTGRASIDGAGVHLVGLCPDETEASILLDAGCL